MNLNSLWLIVLALIVGSLGWWFYAQPATPVPIDVVPQPFVSENVKVSSPLIGATVQKTFTVKGEARGSWMFEANLPVEVRDANGKRVSTGYTMSTSENWMTAEFVPFEGTLTVENYSGPATLVVSKDNPSDMRELDDSVSFPIVIE